ncbi:hypothetical protein F8388_006633 [Cannabis sativa]|uniref:Uncharacterized protein n=1 Tax=Cannabis sativa TaxID=3483 RepID=A0A7J6HE49_CANSA|nr:hypothetical protein F8388_006633 [Cannabis sativa]KAF4392908.1 hypothetical protein G4B88_011903 [Cannabis sativa]
MRIRKNAKVSPLLFSSHASAPEVLQSHVCQLNQSPWDVIPFAQYSFSNQGYSNPKFHSLILFGQQRPIRQKGMKIVSPGMGASAILILEQ